MGRVRWSRVEEVPVRMPEPVRAMILAAMIVDS